MRTKTQIEKWLEDFWNMSGSTFAIGIGVAFLAVLLDRYFSEKKSFVITQKDLGMSFCYSIISWVAVIFIVLKWAIIGMAAYWRVNQDRVVIRVKKR